MISSNFCDSGGTILTVTGEFLDSVAEPKLTVTGVVTSGSDSRFNVGASGVEFESSVSKASATSTLVASSSNHR